MSSKLDHATTPQHASYPRGATTTSASPSAPPLAASSVELTLPDGPRQTDVGELVQHRARILVDPRPSNLDRQQRNGQVHRKLTVATPVPDPAHGYQGPRAMAKPGASEAFKPVNSLNGNAIADRINPRSGRSRQTTYGKHSRTTKSISAQRHWREQQLDQSARPSTVAHDVSRPSPIKRRKIQHSTVEPVKTVEIQDSDEDEIQQVPLSARHAPAPRARSTLSSQSPHSAASRYSDTGTRLTSQPISEFTSTNNMMNPRRASNRRPWKAAGRNENRMNLLAEVPPDAAGTHGHIVDSVNNHTEPSSVTARRAILEAFEQGVKPTTESKEPRRSDASVTSAHFSAMRINESTAEARNQPASGVSTKSKNLRDFRPAESGTTQFKGNCPEGSEDELAQMTPSAPKPRYGQSSSKLVREKSLIQQDDAAERCYQLKYVRTHDTVPDRTQLYLRHTETPESFRITGADVNGNVKTIHTLNLQLIDKIVADNTHRMRLIGSYDAHGPTYWYDLEFENAYEFAQFKANHVNPGCPRSNQITKSPRSMKQLFDEPFGNHDQIGKSPTVHEEPSSDQIPNDYRAQSKTPHLDALLGKFRNIDDSVGSTDGASQQLLPPSRAQTRQTRSTRSTNPTQSEGIDRTLKHSVEHGLGPQWDKPLEFKLSEGFLKRRPGIVHFQDLPRLDEEEMLNDDLINFDMLYLYNQFKVPTDRVYFFTTQFFESLTRNTKGRDAINYDAVKNWTKRDDIFSYDYIVVPINENFHWYLAIICNVSRIARSVSIDNLNPNAPSQQPLLNDRRVTSEDEKANKKRESTLNVDEIPVDKPAYSEQPVAGLPIIDDDENLFEEEKRLSLVDRDDGPVEKEPELSDKQDRRYEVHTEPNGSSTAAPLFQTKNPPLSKPLYESEGFSRKKSKRKPTGHRRDPEKPVIMILDSLSQPHANASRALREWLQAEGLNKRDMTVEIDNKGYYPKSAHIPMQNNFSDCGLYVLGYAEKFFRDPDGFKTKLLTGEMSAETDWPDMDPSRMRDSLRKLIFRLYTEQVDARHKARKAAKAKATQMTPNVGERKTNSSPLQQSSIAEDTTLTGVHTAVDARISTTSALAKAASPRLMTASSCREVHSHTPERAKVDDDSYFSTPARTSPTVPSKVSSVQLKQSSSKRQRTPEISVPGEPSHVDQPSYLQHHGTIGSTHQPTQKLTGSASHLQKLNRADKGKLRMPTTKRVSKSSPSGLRQDWQTLSRSSHSRTRSGSHVDPITLDGSQDLDDPVQQQSGSKYSPQSEIIGLDPSQETIVSRQGKAIDKRTSAGRNPRIQDTLDRNESVQTGIDDERQEGRATTRALRASLKEKEVLKHLPSDTSNKVDCRREDVMGEAGDAQPLQTLEQASETQVMDVDDDTIPETPEPESSGVSEDVDVDEDQMDWQTMVDE